MFLTEFDEAEVMSQFREEYLAEGIAEGIAEGRAIEIFQSVADGDYSPERGAQKLGVTLADFIKMMNNAGY